MARASTKTLLTLDRFAQLIGMHPLHFNGVELNNAEARICGDAILQHNWQHADRVSREEIAQAISDAEQNMEEWLGYAPLPKWYVDERNVERVGGHDITGRGQAVQTEGGFLITGGIEAKVSLQLLAPIVYADVDSDGYAERATITVAGLPSYVTNPEEIAIYYPGTLGIDEWEIRPIICAITGTTATITCSRHQLVAPEKLEQLIEPRAVDGSTAGNFLTTVDVYRHYNDPQRQVQFLWEGGCDCGCADGCSYATQWGCLLVRNNRLGLVSAHPSEWDASTSSFTTTEFSPCRYPDRSRLWYRAGFRNMSFIRPHHTMDTRFERAVAYYAIGLLGRPICGCSAIKEIANHWGHDMATSVSTRGATVSRNMSRRLLDNPFGTTRGAIYAWNVVRQAKLGESVIHA